MIRKSTIVYILRKLEPSLTESDERVFEMAFNDLIDYYLIKKAKLNSLSEWKEITNKELTEWLKIWLQKYRQRVKLVFKFPKIRGQRINPRRVLTTKELNELLTHAREILIEHLEICGISMIANHVVQESVNQYLSTKKIKYLPIGKERILALSTILSIVARNTKRMCLFNGALIFIKPSKEYLIREWRDFGLVI